MYVNLSILKPKVSNHVHSLLGKSKQAGQQIPYNLLIIYVCLSVVLKMRPIPHSAACIGRYLCTFFPFYLILSSTSDHPSSIDVQFSSLWKDPSKSTYNVAIITSKASFRIHLSTVQVFICSLLMHLQVPILIVQVKPTYSYSRSSFVITFMFD